MASNKSVSERTVEFWRSAVDEFMEEFLEAAESGDQDKAIVAGARLAQLGMSMSVFWKVGTNALIDSKERADLFNGSTRAVAMLCQRHIDSLADEADKLEKDPLQPPTSEPKLDRSMN